MARTLAEIRASRPVFDRERLAATTEADIRRYMIEDGENPDAPLPVFTKRRPGERGPGRKPSKVPLSLRVDADVLAKLKSFGPGWQGRIGQALADLAERDLAREDASRAEAPLAGARAHGKQSV